MSDKYIQDKDPKASSRKQDHIELAFRSQVSQGERDGRFYYEPMLSGHPEKGSWPEFTFVGKQQKLPLWVSSMTGGTTKASRINKNLARACREFGMGMGLGSCRSLLSSDQYFDDFNVRPFIGDELPLYANLGIAQIEILLRDKKVQLASEMVKKLQADGLIIHVNPLQEWLQPEGDHISDPPIETIARFLEACPMPIIVKEVGQGFGPASIKALLKMPLMAIEFAANGGTNFSRLELLRADDTARDTFGPVVQLGHSAEEMVNWANEALLDKNTLCKDIIISGGIKHFLDGYYLLSKSKMNAVYGQASGFLKYAQEDYETLQKYIEMQVRGLELAKAFLKLKV